MSISILSMSTYQYGNLISCIIPGGYIPDLLSVSRRREFLGILSTDWKDGCTQRVVDCSLLYLGKFQYTQMRRASRSKSFILFREPWANLPCIISTAWSFNDISIGLWFPFLWPTTHEFRSYLALAWGAPSGPWPCPLEKSWLPGHLYL